MSETVDGFKQRLVGAFVILSLAIIFLPMIFDQPHVQENVVISAVPPAPVYKTVIIRDPQRPQYEALQLDPVDNKVKKLSKLNSKPTNTKQVDAAPSRNKELNIAKRTNKVVAASDNSAKKKKAKLSSSSRVSHLPIFKNVWMVQLGTFSNRNNAIRLRDKLRQGGFDGHTKDVKLKGKTAVRVFTGPFINKRQAQKTKLRVDKKYKVDSRLIFFDA